MREHEREINTLALTSAALSSSPTSHPYLRGEWALQVIQPNPVLFLPQTRHDQMTKCDDHNEGNDEWNPRITHPSEQWAIIRMTISLWTNSKDSLRCMPILQMITVNGNMGWWMLRSWSSVCYSHLKGDFYLQSVIPILETCKRSETKIKQGVDEEPSLQSFTAHKEDGAASNVL